MSEPLYFNEQEPVSLFFSQALAKPARRMGFEFTVRRCLAPGHSDWLCFNFVHLRGFTFTVVTTTDDWAEALNDVSILLTEARPRGLID